MDWIGGGGRGNTFGALFLKKCPFLPISNAALNFYNIPGISR